MLTQIKPFNTQAVPLYLVCKDGVSRFSSLDITNDIADRMPDLSGVVASEGCFKTGVFSCQEIFHGDGAEERQMLDGGLFLFGEVPCDQAVSLINEMMNAGLFDQAILLSKHFFYTYENSGFLIFAGKSAFRLDKFHDAFWFSTEADRYLNEEIKRSKGMNKSELKKTQRDLRELIDDSEEHIRTEIKLLIHKIDDLPNDVFQGFGSPAGIFKIEPELIFEFGIPSVCRLYDLIAKNNPCLEDGFEQRINSLEESLYRMLDRIIGGEALGQREERIFKKSIESGVVIVPGLMDSISRVENQPRTKKNAASKAICSFIFESLVSAQIAKAREVMEQHPFKAYEHLEYVLENYPDCQEARKLIGIVLGKISLQKFLNDEKKEAVSIAGRALEYFEYELLSSLVLSLVNSSETFDIACKNILNKISKENVQVVLGTCRVLAVLGYEDFGIDITDQILRSDLKEGISTESAIKLLADIVDAATPYLISDRRDYVENVLETVWKLISERKIEGNNYLYFEIFDAASKIAHAGYTNLAFKILDHYQTVSADIEKIIQFCKASILMRTEKSRQGLFEASEMLRPLIEKSDFGDVYNCDFGSINRNIPLRASFYLVRGLIHLEFNEGEELIRAREIFSDGMKKYPDVLIFRHLIAKADFKLREYSKVEEGLRSCIDQDPFYLHPYLDLYLLLLELNDNEGAKKAFDSLSSKLEIIFNSPEKEMKSRVDDNDLILEIIKLCIERPSERERLLELFRGLQKIVPDLIKRIVFSFKQTAGSQGLNVPPEIYTIAFNVD